MRQIQFAPLRVVVTHLGKLEVAGLRKITLAVAEAEILCGIAAIAELKFPAEVEEQLLARGEAEAGIVRGGCQQAAARAQAERARSDEVESANPEQSRSRREMRGMKDLFRMNPLTRRQPVQAASNDGTINQCRGELYTLSALGSDFSRFGTQTSRCESTRSARCVHMINSEVSPLQRRDGRVAEGARLESVFRGNSNVGSNPTLSAKTIIINTLETHRLDRERSTSP